MTDPDPPLCAEPRCQNKGRIWQDGARWCGAHWVPPVPTPDVALATIWEPAHIDLPGRRKITPSTPKEPPSAAEKE